MSVQILIDMNLSPDWVSELSKHDLDFGTMLALAHSSGPSVIQVRSQNTMPDHMATTVVAALKQHETDLAGGAFVVVDESRWRVRVLPI